MAVRCKMHLHSRTSRLMSVYNRETQHSDMKETQSFEFSVVTSQDTPEDKAFFLATPTGRLEIGVVNPEVVKHLKIGKDYFITITEAE